MPRVVELTRKKLTVNRTQLREYTAVSKVLWEQPRTDHYVLVLFILLKYGETHFLFSVSEDVSVDKMTKRKMPVDT